VEHFEQDLFAFFMLAGTSHTSFTSLRAQYSNEVTAAIYNGTSLEADIEQLT
jgi:hypothetical protein